MSLTIEEMDDINVLLTEVSLELLGNKFYDIHGQAHETLRELYLPNVKVRPNYEADQCDLMLNVMKVSKAQEAPISSNNVPLSIKRRRNTMAVREPNRAANLPVQPQVKKRVSIDMLSYKPADNAAVPESTPRTQPKSSVNFVESEIKNNVAQELVQKLELSKELRMKHFLANRSRMAAEYLDEYEIVQEFHANEKIELMSDSGALIELIKFIKCDPANAHKIGTIAANILHVKDLI